MTPMPRIAASEKNGLSPTLQRCESSIFPSPLPFYLRILAWTLALIVPTTFYLGPLMVILPPFLYLYSTKAALILLIIDCILIFYPHKEWPWFRRIFEIWYDIFNIHHNLILDPETNTMKVPDGVVDRLLILAMHPHGIIPMQGFIWAAFCDHYLTRGQAINPTGTEGLYGFGATTDAALWVPLVRQLLIWLSAGSATRKVLRKSMNKGKNLYILPGGVAEIFVSEPRRHALVAKRHGLMKLALQTGACVIPMYVFGGTDLHEHLATYKGGETFMKFSRFLKAGFTVFWGQWGTPMPFAVEKYCLVMGDPIEPVVGTMGEGNLGGRETCRQVENPSKEQVQDLLERYMDAMNRLFDQYKAQAGYPDATLEFL